MGWGQRKEKRVPGACPVATDLIMRVNVRTTTAVCRITTSVRVVLAAVTNILARLDYRPDTTFCTSERASVCKA